MKSNHSKFKQLSLSEENREFRKTGGVSSGNRGAGFIPAFLDTNTGYAYPSTFANGQPAPVHMFDGLPDTLVKKSVVTGKIYALREGLVSGFIRNSKFYTRKEAAGMIAASTF